MTEIVYDFNPKLEYRDKWGRGEWDSEPDKIQWTDQATDYPCLVVRNRMGALCGYVGVPRGHRFYEVGYDDVDAPAHGGLTYANHCQEGPENETICHVPAPGESDDVWWLGFDCAHAGDLIPGMAEFYEEFEAKRGPSPYVRDETYKNVSYVRSECAELAVWLAEHA